LTVAQINNHPGNVEFVFDPDSGIFALGSNAIKDMESPLMNGSPHQTIARSIGANENTVVGGMTTRLADGRLAFNEQSGHYHLSWTAEIRLQFGEAVTKYGIR